jgi:hypothetical protein
MMVYNGSLQPGARVPTWVRENVLHHSERHTGTAWTFVWYYYLVHHFYVIYLISYM